MAEPRKPGGSSGPRKAARFEFETSLYLRALAVALPALLTLLIVMIVEGYSLALILTLMLPLAMLLLLVGAWYEALVVIGL